MLSKIETARRTAALRRLVALFAVLGLTASACGSSAPNAGPATDDETTAAGSDTRSGEGAADRSEADESETDDAMDEPSEDGDEVGGDNKPVATLEGSSRARLGSVIDSAVDPAVAQNSARFTGTLEFETDDPALGGTVSLNFSGGYDLAEESMDMEIDFSGMLESMAAGGGLSGMEAMFEDPMMMRSIGNDGWMQWGLFTIAGVQAGQWVHMSADDVGDLTAGFGVAGATTQSPMTMLTHLRDIEADILEVGAETVSGVETTHYKALVDLEAAAAQLDEATREQLSEAFAESQGPVPMEFWIGDDGLLYRWSISLGGASLGEGADVDSMTMTYEFADYGADVNIVPPDPADVVEGDSLGF